MERRDFFKAASLGAGALLANPMLAAFAVPSVTNRKKPVINAR